MMSSKTIVIAFALSSIIVLSPVFLNEADGGGGDFYSHGEIKKGGITQDDNVLTITDLELEGKDGPGLSILSGDVTLKLVGTNKIAGAPGFAGVYVKSGATLTIESNSGGILYAYGGNGANSEGTTGAGIGGNGSNHDEEYVEDFGTVNILSGTVYAYGGSSKNNLSGGAAGIGSGSVAEDTDVTVTGSVNISGGTVVAEGGTYPKWSGGAGIGSGSSSNGIGSAIYITISSDAKVTATGGEKGDAAGIGGGAGSAGGTIRIEGGIIEATGTSSGSGCGSGIGGGDPGAATITITGGYVEANSSFGHCIGSGYTAFNVGIISELHISGGTVVTGTHSTYPSITASMVITGGSLNTGGVHSANNGQESVYCVALDFNGLSEDIPVESIGVEGYGMNDVITDSEGRVYVWLPKGTVLDSATVDSGEYAPNEPYTVSESNDVQDLDLFISVKHQIHVMTEGEGYVKTSLSEASSGTPITLTVTPAEGYRLGTVSTVPEVELSETEEGYSFVMPDSEVTVTVVFVIDSHTVTFYNGNEVHWSYAASHGEPLVFPEEPAMDSTESKSYTFSHWEYEGSEVEEGRPVTEDMDLSAVFVESDRVYTVAFMVEGSEYDVRYYQYGDVIIPPENPVLDGYDFVEWEGFTDGMTVDSDETFTAVFVESSDTLPPIVPWFPEDENVWVPPNIVYVQNQEESDDLWIFVVLGSVALCLFLIFIRYERRD